MRIKILAPLFLVVILLFIATLPWGSGRWIAKRVDQKLNPVLLDSRISELPPLDIPVIDLHADTSLWGRDFFKPGGHIDYERLIQSNVLIQVFSIVSQVPMPQKYEGNHAHPESIGLLRLFQGQAFNELIHPETRIINQIQTIRSWIDQSDGKLRLIQSAQDIDQLLIDRGFSNSDSASRASSGSFAIGVMIALEGVHSKTTQIENIERFFDLGVRIFGMAHFFDNPWSGSRHGHERGGITDHGHRLIQAIQKRGGIIDMAHSSENAMKDSFKIRLPSLVSHTGISPTCDHTRNLSLDEISALSESQSLIGIGIWDTATCSKNLDGFLNAVRWAEKQTDFHTGMWALGSDFDGAVQVPFTIEHWGNVASFLIQNGISRDFVERLFYKNALQFLKSKTPPLR